MEFMRLVHFTKGMRSKFPDDVLLKVGFSQICQNCTISNIKKLFSFIEKGFERTFLFNSKTSASFDCFK